MQMKASLLPVDVSIKQYHGYKKNLIRNHKIQNKKVLNVSTEFFICIHVTLHEITIKRGWG